MRPAQRLDGVALRLPALCVMLLSLAAAGARAEDIAFGDTAVHTVTRSQYREDLQRLSTLVAACAANATACDPQPVVNDERIAANDQPNPPIAFEMHWSWLRSALHASQTAKPEDRARLMREAQAQLDSMMRETGGAGKPAEAFPPARAAADSILRSPEFEGITGTTWWDRLMARVQNFLARMINGVGALGTAAPWLGILLEWLLFLTAAVGLLVFILRTIARQRMKLALGQTAPADTAWAREAEDWAQQAQAHAGAAEWREAVHCLYWAAIVHLEVRRAWRHNPTRTPREYVRLLKPGSPQQQGLRGLTWLLERLWYGQRETTEADFERAQRCFEQLSSAAGAPAPTATPAGVTA